MEKYNQLTFEERCYLSILIKEQYTKVEIAQLLDRNRSTVYRELKRNTGLRGYRAKQANSKAEQRRKDAQKTIKFTSNIIETVTEKTKSNWSPEQISGWLKRKNIEISHERIYQYILAEKQTGGILYKSLRRSNRKRKKRYGSPERRGQIVNRVSIDKRPAIVDNKTRIGDWEGDTIIGRNHKGALVSLVERKSKYTLIRKESSKTSQAVNRAILSMAKNIKEQFKTLTVDNGGEFAKHTELKSSLGVDVYFANPYHSWERGLNENTNGLIRQYFPKKTDLCNISDYQVLHVQHLINNRPRKTLGYCTPSEVFNHFISFN